MLPTSKEYLFSFYGTLLAGGIPVPLYPPARLTTIEDHLTRAPLVAAARVGRVWGFFRVRQEVDLDVFFERRGHWPSWAGTWMYYALVALSVMVESGFTPAALAYLADTAGQGEGRGAAMGVYTLLLGLGNALGAGIGGVLAKYLAFDGLILGTVALAIVALAALTLLPAAEIRHPVQRQRDPEGTTL